MFWHVLLSSAVNFLGNEGVKSACQCDVMWPWSGAVNSPRITLFKKVDIDLCSFDCDFRISLITWLPISYRVNQLYRISSWLVTGKIYLLLLVPSAREVSRYRYSVWWKPWNVDSFLVWHIPGWSDPLSVKWLSIIKLMSFIHPNFSNSAACESHN